MLRPGRRLGQGHHVRAPEGANARPGGDSTRTGHPPGAGPITRQLIVAACVGCALYKRARPCRSPSLCSSRCGALGAAGDCGDHAAEDNAVDRVEAVPVKQTGQPAWLVVGGLSQQCTAGHRLGDELEPAPPGQLHLRPQPDQPARLDFLHPPPVQRFARQQLVVVAPSRAADRPRRRSGRAAHAIATTSRRRTNLSVPRCH